MADIDPILVDAQNKSARAKVLCDNFVEMARICDWNASNRWHKEAEKAIEKAERAIGHISGINPPPPADHDIYTIRAKRDLARAKKAFSDAERMFQACVDPRTAPKVLFRFENHTRYNIPTVVRLTPIAGDPSDKITISATMTGNCAQPCFVSVYSIEKADTGKRVNPPSLGDNRYGPGGNPSNAPKDVDAFDGFVVDAPPTASKPCWPGSSYNSNTKQLSADDAPNVIKDGHIGSFETCAVCIENGQVTVLGCMRWTVDGDNKIKFVLQHIGQSPQPTPPFERALKHWMNRRTP